MATIYESPFLGYLHSFRGFAIINIVAIHSIVFALLGSSNFNFDPKSPIAFINELLFHNSTIYFALISGVLFTVVLKSKGYKNFYLSKVKYVLMPYLFFTLIFSLFPRNTNDWFALQPDILTYFKAVLSNYWLGKADFTYWYLPVLIFLYLVTPLLNFLLTLKYGGIIFLIIILAPLVISRVEVMEMGNSLSLPTMIYFMGAYAGGMYLGENLETRLSWIRKNYIAILAIALLSSFTLIYIHQIDFNKLGFVSVWSSLFYIQKMCLSVLVLLVFKNLGDKQPSWLHRIATDAFTIYFIHSFFVAIAMGALLPFLTYTKISPFNIILGAIIILIISMGLSMLFALLFKRIFGRYSKMVVGS